MKRIISRIKKKIKKNSGFSLVEMLFAILILMLSTTVIIQCFNLGIGTFIKETQASEAQILCEALTTSIQSEIAYAQDVKVTSASGGVLSSYFSTARRLGNNCTLQVVGGQIMIIPNGVTDPKEYYPLVSSANYTRGHRAGVSGDGGFLYAFLSPLEWNGSTFEVKLYINDSQIDSEPSDPDSVLAYSNFRIKPINGVTVE